MESGLGSVVVVGCAGWQGAAVLQLGNELFDRDTRTPDQRSQGSAIKLFMIRHGEMASVSVIQNYMASPLTEKENKRLEAKQKKKKNKNFLNNSLWKI